jgi:aminoglycoside phosphotransferase (APT) family kinase protein
MPVSEVREIVGTDPAAVTQWLHSLDLEFVGPLSFQRIGLGQSNLTYLVRDDDGRQWVLRRPPLGHLLASAHDVAREARIREARIMAALEHTDVPVPRIFGVAQDPEISQVPLVLMAFINGQVVDTMQIAESLAPHQRRQIGVSLPKTLAKIHAVDIKEAGLSDLASHQPYAGRQLKRWAGQWERSKTRELPELDDLTRRLVVAAPEQRELSLVHGDFHLRNAIVSHAAGDFAASTLDGFPNRAELAQIYLNQTGRDPQALTYWHALGLWKVAVIAEGLMRRAMDTPQNKAAAGTPTIERIDALVHKAREIAAAANI